MFRIVISIILIAASVVLGVGLDNGHICYITGAITTMILCGIALIDSSIEF